MVVRVADGVGGGKVAECSGDVLLTVGGGGGWYS